MRRLVPVPETAAYRVRVNLLSRLAVIERSAVSDIYARAPPELYMEVNYHIPI